MLQSSLFTKTLREAPKDEQARNAQFLVRGGYVDKLMAGVYSFLPLGLRVLSNIERIIREEMNAIGGQEVRMPALHPIENYKTTGREDIDVLFHLETNTGQNMVLGQSHEEVVVPLVKKYVESYRDLPVSVYQIQTKFRNELRPKSGIFRGREFLMKDLYSFHADEKDFEVYYEKAKEAYTKVFERVGLGKSTLMTFASGGTFSKYSHEYQTITDAGEDDIYICKACNIAVNKEVMGDLEGTCPKCKEKLPTEATRAIEVGNIFPLKSKYSDAFQLTYKDKEGKPRPVIMGCYGIGLSRLMGAVAEVQSDDKGIMWPDEVAPFRVHIIPLSEKSNGEAQKLYDELVEKGLEVLLDDREDLSAGQKFGDADLIGIPWRVVISDKTLADDKIEVKHRTEKDANLITQKEFLKLVLY
ncbi:MAG: His/Gly/Thr/Pro-type tRNA ligase C-terminal domain-containing protein [bacterium]|nr:His/Gly/Thr/Pro-type tRNA ligase C-terminal domain-containing protein [bacterium]